MDIIQKALEFESRKTSFKSMNDKILAAREVKNLILGVNEIYKQKKEAHLMDLMKRLTAIKKKIEVRLKGIPETFDF